MTILSETALKAINAYGGIELWQTKKYIEAEVSVHGLAFTLKRRPVFEHVKIKMEISRPFSKITPIGKNETISGILEGNDVRLEDKDNNIISERKNARKYFPYGRRLLFWDDLDMTYFANYAFWNYFTLPKLLTNNKIEWVEKSPGLLHATFPDNIPTHSKMQDFYFDKATGLLVQHNYTVDIISALAKAANIVRDNTKTDNYYFPSSRLVTPQGKNGKAMKRPTLIDMTIHSFRLTD